MIEYDEMAAFHRNAKQALVNNLCCNAVHLEEAIRLINTYCIPFDKDKFVKIKDKIVSLVDTLNELIKDI